MIIVKTLKIADIFTIGNLSCGILSIFAASNENYTTSAFLIVLSLILDVLDGKVAKLMHQANSFGKQLDSLADLVSFGLAPAFLFYSLEEPGFGVALILILFSVCGMLRLARYNLSEGSGFEGVPITVNGVIFPGLYFLSIYFPPSLLFWPAVYALMSVLMVSSFRVNRIF